MIKDLLRYSAWLVMSVLLMGMGRPVIAASDAEQVHHFQFTGNALTLAHPLALMHSPMVIVPDLEAEEIEEKEAEQRSAVSRAGLPAIIRAFSDSASFDLQDSSSALAHWVAYRMVSAGPSCLHVLLRTFRL